MPVNGQYPNNPGRGLPKQPDLSMQIPLVCPGRPGEPACGTNVFIQSTVVLYTRHRLKATDRRFDSPLAVGTRFACMACGRALTSEDFNSPMDPPAVKPA
jgi:hypothetical protein